MRHNRPPPEIDSGGDREEFQALAADLLDHLGQAFEDGLAPERRPDLERARAEGADPRTRELRGQIFLARHLPDYWQIFEAHRAAHAEARLAAPPPKTGFLKRLFNP
jgi:hypothetical protein